MDRVHNIEDKPWICKRRMNLKDCRQERNNQLRKNNVDLSGKLENFSSRYHDLCNELDKFVSRGAKEVKPYFAFNLTEEKFLTKDDECNLKSYKLQLEHAKRMISDRGYKIKYLSYLKTTRREMLMRYLASAGQRNPQSRNEYENNLQLAVDDNELNAIVVVQLWHQPSKYEKVRLEKEVLFRSDQCLVELRDQFKCHRDYGVPMDLSNDPDQQIERIFHGELFKSGFFLIESTFFNDLRDPNNSDLSATLINWAEEKVTIVGDDDRTRRVSRGIGPFKRERMEETKFEDLIIRLGYPYVYCHQGNCEHLFTISDIRYLPSASGANCELPRYPVISASSIGRKEYNLKCYMCRLRPPHWYTRNNARLPLDPYFFCENCFRSFNYDKDKKKIGNFQAYLYTSALGIPDSLVIRQAEKA